MQPVLAPQLPGATAGLRPLTSIGKQTEMKSRKAESKAGECPAAFKLTIGIWVLMVLAWFGFVIFRPPPGFPDAAPEDGAPPLSNMLVLDKDRVEALGLSTCQITEAGDVMFVPHESVQTAPNGNYLWVKDYDLETVFLKTRVTAGSRQDDMIEIRHGVLPGDEVVVRNADKLRFEKSRPIPPPDSGGHVTEHSQ